MLSRELELARDPNCLISAVLKEFDRAHSAGEMTYA